VPMAHRNEVLLTYGGHHEGHTCAAPECRADVESGRTNSRDHCNTTQASQPPELRGPSMPASAQREPAKCYWYHHQSTSASRLGVSMTMVIHVAGKTQPGHGEALAMTVMIAAHADRCANMPVLRMLGRGTTGYWTSVSSVLSFQRLGPLFRLQEKDIGRPERSSPCVDFLLKHVPHLIIGGFAGWSQEEDSAVSVVIALFAACLRLISFRV